LEPALARRRILIRSFSSLHRASMAQEDATYGEHLPRAAEEDEEPPEKEEVLRGAVFGNLVHDVLEKMDYDAVRAATEPGQLLEEKRTRPVIEDYVRWYAPQISSRLKEKELASQCRQQVARLAWYALHTPLAAAGCRLCDVPKRDRLHELEFQFPEWQGPAPAGTPFWGGVLAGFMEPALFRSGGGSLIYCEKKVRAGYH